MSYVSHELGSSWKCKNQRSQTLNECTLEISLGNFESQTVLKAVEFPLLKYSIVKIYLARLILKSCKPTLRVNKPFETV